MVLLNARQEAGWIGTTYSRAILGTVWTFAGITTLAFLGRLYIRYRRFARLDWDDFFVVIAWMTSIPLAAQVTVSSLYSRTREGGAGPVFTNRLLTQFFFYTCLWSIKISFLIFFRKLGGTALQRLRIYWKLVTGFTVLTYFAVWALNPYGCFLKKGMMACAVDPEVRRLMPITFSVVCGLDILTDCLIMVIPFAILHRVRISMRQRLILYSLFSLVIVTMSVAIVRAVLSVRGMRQSLNVTWLIFLSFIEADTAIIIACLGSLRALFTQDDRSRSPTYRRSWVSPPMRGRFPRSESVEALNSTDLQDLPSKSTSLIPSTFTPSASRDDRPNAPKAQLRDQSPATAKLRS